MRGRFSEDPQHVRHELAAYLAGELESAEAWRVRKHLEHCAACRSAWQRHEAALERAKDVTRELRATLPQLGRPTAGQLARIWQRIVAVYRGEIQLSSSKSLRSAGAMLVVTLACLWVAFVFGGSTSYATSAPLPPVPMELEATATPIVTEAPLTSVVQAEQQATASQTAPPFRAILSASPVPVAFELPR